MHLIAAGTALSAVMYIGLGASTSGAQVLTQQMPNFHVEFARLDMAHMQTADLGVHFSWGWPRYAGSRILCGKWHRACIPPADNSVGYLRDVCPKAERQSLWFPAHHSRTRYLRKTPCTMPNTVVVLVPDDVGSQCLTLLTPRLSWCPSQEGSSAAS